MSSISCTQKRTDMSTEVYGLQIPKYSTNIGVFGMALLSVYPCFHYGLPLPYQSYRTYSMVWREIIIYTPPAITEIWQESSISSMPKPFWWLCSYSNHHSHRTYKQDVYYPFYGTCPPTPYYIVTINRWTGFLYRL